MFNVLRSLVGAAAEDQATLQVGFESSPDSTGLNFYLPHGDFDRLKASASGTGLQKMQIILLRMLEEQGMAEPIANGFHVPSETVVRLDEEQANVLQLPPMFPGRFESHISSHARNSAFRVNLFAAFPEGRAPFERVGPLLRFGPSEAYRLNPGELLGVQSWEAHRDLEPGERGEAANLRLMAELQVAQRSGMNIDLSHFDKIDVVVPEHIGVVATQHSDGSVTLSPSLGDGSTPDELERRWGQVDMNAEGGVIRVGNRVVLLEPEKMAGVKEVLGSRHIPADRVADFIRSPSAFLDAALVNLDLGFSARVEGVGRLTHMDFSDPDAKPMDWFATSVRAESPGALKTVIKSDEDLQRVEEVFAAAREQGADTLEYGGKQIDISDAEAVSAVLDGIKRDGIPSQSSAESGPKEEKEPEETVGVILKDADELHTELIQKAENARVTAEPDWSRYARSPFPHQREGVLWMLGLIRQALAEKADDLYRLQGGLLADDMGLGKTYMGLVAMGEYLASSLSDRSAKKPMLVVAPLTLLENWEEEVHKTFGDIPFRDIVVLQSGRDLKDYRVSGAARESAQLSSLLDEQDRVDESDIRYALNIGPDAGARRLDMDRRLVLTTYQTLRDYQFSLCKIDWGMVVFDEAQNIKNPNTLQTRAAKGLKADFKLLATGTPVENSLGDFWCLMDTAQPGLLGSWDHFRDAWIKPILAADEKDRDQVRQEIGTELRQTVGPFMLRRVKEDQLPDLPVKKVHFGIVESTDSPAGASRNMAAYMRGSQLQAYDAVLNDYRAQSESEDMRGRALSALQRLREASLHPRLHSEGELYASTSEEARSFMRESAKLGVLLDLLDDIRQKDEKAILFMATKKLQRVLKLWLDQIYGLDVGIINGDTPSAPRKSDIRTRKQLIRDFEAQPGFNLLIMSPIAAGVGLTVVEANHAVHIERHWNPAKEAQASDRIYRIGQKRDVHIYMPAALHPEFDSFDLHLHRLLSRKLMLKDAVVTTEEVSESELVRSMGL
nr:DEAD/DEAH box helicase [Guyparkeria hydrothermalis]